MGTTRDGPMPGSGLTQMIRSTSDAEVRALIEALDAGPPARREGAIARLNVLGTRPVARLISAYAASTPGRRLAILRVLEASADDRALPIARRALEGLEEGEAELGVAAVALLRALLERGGAAEADALDLLLAASHDARLERRVRAAAAGALTSAPEDIREAIGHQFDALGSEGDAIWDEAVEGRLPADPGTLREALDGRAERAPLPAVLRIIEAIRRREDMRQPCERQAEWREVRGALHQAVAARGSRIALYDARETVEGARAPLPASFLSAMQAIGDASCLEPLASAFARAHHAHGWRRQLAHTFHVVARRAGVTRRHSSMRRALAQAPELARTDGAEPAGGTARIPDQ